MFVGGLSLWLHVFFKEPVCLGRIHSPRSSDKSKNGTNNVINSARSLHILSSITIRVALNEVLYIFKPLNGLTRHIFNLRVSSV